MMRSHSGLSRILCCGVSFAGKRLLEKVYGSSAAVHGLPPNLVDVKLTIKCNLRCEQCSVWKAPKKEELSTQVWKNIILNIKECVGPYFIHFYGGEPFLREDFLELVEFTALNNIGVLITTNGSLIDAKAAKILKRNRVSMIQISLDGFNPQTHDKLRGVEGTHRRVMSAIDLLQGKVPLQINTTIMESNIDEVLLLADFARLRQIAISFQGVINANSFDRDLVFKSANDLLPKDRDKVSRVIDALCRMKRVNGKIVNSLGQLEEMKSYLNRPVLEELRVCKAFGSHLWVKEGGDLFGCTFRDSIGNLADRSLRDIWRDPETKRRMKEMLLCNKTHCRAMRGCSRETNVELLTKIWRTIFC